MGCHALPQMIFHTQGLKPTGLMSPALAGGFFTTSAIWEAHSAVYFGYFDGLSTHSSLFSNMLYGFLKF